jgi:hypothetical protein
MIDSSRLVKIRVTIPMIGAAFCFTPLVAFGALWLASFSVDALAHHLTLRKSLYVGIEHGCISFFNDEQYGPYHGSVIALTDGIHTIPDLDKSGFDFPGIYYRWFHFKTSPPALLWTLTFSLLFPIALAAIPAELWAIGRITKRRGIAGKPFQFGIRDISHGTLWLCISASLFATFASGGGAHRLAFYGAILAACIGVGATCRRIVTGAIIGATLLMPFALIAIGDFLSR